MSFSVHTRSLGPVSTNAIAIANDATREMILFDAPVGVGSFISQFSDYRLSALLLTHGHFDHILGVSELPPGLPTYAHPGDKKLYTRPHVMSAWLSPAEAASLQPVQVTHWLPSEGSLQLIGIDLQLLFCPGHSPGSMVFHLPSLSAAVSGDCIFQGSIGRTDLPGGSYGELMGSISRHLLTLPAHTTLYCGHGPSTTVSHEKQHNEFLITGSNRC